MTTALIRPRILYAWNGPSLLVLNVAGEASVEEGLSGFYFRETRFLRTLRLEVNGAAPWLCEAAEVAPPTLAFTYVYPEVAEYGGGGTGTAGDDLPRDRHGIPQRALAI